MTKYSMYKPNQKDKPVQKPIHPIWRGIGCILLIVIPVISYIAADFLIINRSTFSWLIIPQEFVVNNLPDPLLLVKIFYTAIFVAVLYLLLTIITFVINRFFGPSRYGPYDVPIDKVQRK
ncbi:MAG: hypothetical protein AB9897_08025 [Anaerolineaceae bacterium]